MGVCHEKGVLGLDGLGTSKAGSVDRTQGVTGGG